MTRPDDGTEDFDERCDGTVSCDCGCCWGAYDVACRVCGEPFEDDEPGIWNGVEWAHERCDEQPTPPPPPCPATLNLFDAD